MISDIAALHEAIKKNVADNSLWLELADAFDDAGRLMLASILREAEREKTMSTSFGSSYWRKVNHIQKTAKDGLEKKVSFVGIPGMIYPNWGYFGHRNYFHSYLTFFLAPTEIAALLAEAD